MFTRNLRFIQPFSVSFSSTNQKQLRLGWCPDKNRMRSLTLVTLILIEQPGLFSPDQHFTDWSLIYRPDKVCYAILFGA